MLDLVGTDVPSVSLASAAGEGRRYSLGYSVRDALLLGHLSMQFNGTILLAVELRSLACVSWKPKDGRSVPRLRYFAAVPISPSAEARRRDRTVNTRADYGSLLAARVSLLIRAGPGSVPAVWRPR